MKNSILWLRGAREMLGLVAWSERAELAYFDALSERDDDEVLRGLRHFLRLHAEIPTPLQLREVIVQFRTQLSLRAQGEE